MTTFPRTPESGTHIPTEKVSESARQLSELLTAQLEESGAAALRTGDGAIPIAPDLAKFLIEVMDHIKRGQGVTYAPISKRLTTQQAADILNVSRPYLIKVLEAGELPFEKIGRHRRILARDLFAYRRRLERQRADAMSELLANDGDLY